MDEVEAKWSMKCKKSVLAKLRDQNSKFYIQSYKKRVFLDKNWSH
jgi:hypothetical protein